MGAGETTGNSFIGRHVRNGYDVNGCKRCYGK